MQMWPKNKIKKLKLVTARIRENGIEISAFNDQKNCNFLEA